MPNEDDYLDYSRVMSGEDVDAAELNLAVTQQLLSNVQEMIEIEEGMQKHIVPIITGDK